MLVDLAHASPTTFWDVVRETAAPVFVSHANARAVCDHPRNLDDDQLMAIAASRGAVGLVFFPNFVGPQPVTLDGVLAQLEYLASRVGFDSVVIGPDFVDFAVEEMLSDLGAHGDLYDESSLKFPAGLETVAAMQNLVAALPLHGFDEDAIGKLTASNFLRVLEETEAVAG
jgi:membrane dipeptidase